MLDDWFQIRIPASSTPSMRLYNLRAVFLALLPLTAISTTAAAAAAKDASSQIPLGLLPEPWDTSMDFTTALDTLQTTFFDNSTGNWPTSIEWTGAVIATFLAAAVQTLTLTDLELSTSYFNQLVEYFGAQDVDEIENEAYDDMGWVCLNWLEAIKTIDYRVANLANGTDTGIEYKDEFAARALRFYEDVERGWDTTLCGGGMIWNPTLVPYKNAITNELYIAASIGMYLYYPGGSTNQTYLQNAITGHDWLVGVNMTNTQGLYVDGYHISTLDDANVTDKVCDERTENVFTYNQGVFLSGLRGLADATGNQTYLDEGYTLINAVISSQGSPGGELINNGTLTEACDPSATCSQDNQNFKGIFMHHLTLFCNPLTGIFSSEQQKTHAATCTQYDDFITFNAQQVWATRNSTGVMGGWWASPAGQTVAPSSNAVLGFNVTDVADPDLNDRGRGRTVETHAGGVAALRAVLRVVGTSS